MLAWGTDEADEGITATSIIQRTIVINATGDDLMSAVEGGYKSLKAKEDLEKNFPTIDGGTPSYRHQQVMKSSPESIGIARNGYVENIATEKLRSALRRQTTPWHPLSQRTPPTLHHTQPLPLAHARPIHGQIPLPETFRGSYCLFLVLFSLPDRIIFTSTLL